jgi:hypothetical protein
MTVTLNLNPETEARVIAQAEAKGMPVEQFLLSVVESVLAPAQNPLSANERAEAFEAWSAGHRPTTALSDHAVSRDGMYEGREP